MRNARFVVLSLVAGLLAGCTSTAAPPPRPTQKPGPDPLVAALRYTPKPTWRTEVVVDGIDVRDDATLVWSGYGLTMLDTATGKIRWTVESGRDLGGGVRLSAAKPAWLTRHGVLAEYDGGLFLLSAADGTITWQRPTPGRSAPVVAADDRVAMYAAGTSTVVMTTEDGRTLWQADGVTPDGFAGYHALVTDFAGTKVQGLDLITGEAEWTVTPASVVLAAGPYALVDTGAAQIVINTDSGAAVADLGSADRPGCITDQYSVIACPADGGTDTFDIDKKKARRQVPIPRLDAAWDTRLYDRETRDTVDLAGTTVDRDLPGELVGAGASHLVFVVDDIEVRAYPAR